MTLHPDAQALLDGLSAAGVPPFESMTVPQARETANAFMDMQGEPEEVDSVSDLSVPGAGGPIPVRVYRPAGAGDGALPAVVYFHGGGWVIGTLDVVDRPLRQLANRLGAVVVSVDYRLAPEHRFPAGFEDSLAATGWVVDHADDLGVDAAKVLVGGDSAGGNLAAAVALSARASDGPSIAGQLLFYPCLTFGFATESYSALAEGYLLQRATMQWFCAHYLGEQGDAVTDPRAFPAAATNLDGSVPAFIATAEYDPLRSDGEDYAARLREAGVTVQQHQYDGMLHAFYWTLAATPSGAAILDDVAAFVDSLLAARV